MSQSQLRKVQTQLKALMPRLYRFALTLSGDAEHAEKLVCTVCELALDGADDWQPEKAFDRWAFSVMHNAWHNTLRRSHIRNAEAFAIKNPDGLIDPSKLPEKHRQNMQVVNAVMQLPEAHRVVIFLCLVEGQSYSDAAQILNISTDTVIRRLASARDGLTNILRPQNVTLDCITGKVPC